LKVNFTIDGEPVGKGRPRLGKHAVYTPTKTRQYEDLVKYIYKTKCKHFFKDDVKVDIKCYFSIPKSDSKKVKKNKYKNIIRPSKKPDIDNIIKVILDSLNELAYDDDKQVIKSTCEKFYGDEPRVEVTIEDFYSSTQLECIKLTEKMLRNYTQLKSHLNQLEIEKEDLKNYSAKAITYDKDNIAPTNKISKEVEDTIEKIESLEIEFKQESNLVKKIEQALNNLSGVHKDVVKFRYIDGYDWNEIEDMMAYTDRQLRTKKNEALISIATNIFGLQVFKEEEHTLFSLIDL